MQRRSSSHRTIYPVVASDDCVLHIAGADVHPFASQETSAVELRGGSRMAYSDARMREASFRTSQCGARQAHHFGDVRGNEAGSCRSRRCTCTVTVVIVQHYFL